MKKAVKVLLGIAAAGATASAAALAVKKYKDSRKKYACDEFEDDYFDDDECDLDDEYHLTPEEEAELFSTDDHDFGNNEKSDATEDIDTPAYKKQGMEYEVSILEPEDVAFSKYMLNGMINISRIMSGRLEDIERLTRRRNISNAEKLYQIRHLCAQTKENHDLLCRCADNVVDVVRGKTPEDYWEFYEDYEEREGKYDGE